MYAVHPCLNSSKIDLVFIYHWLNMFPWLWLLSFPTFPENYFCFTSSETLFRQMHVHLKKISKISIKVKNGMVQKMFWKGRIVSTTWGIPMEHFCKSALFKQSSKTVLSKHLHVTVLIFVSGFRLIFLIFYCFCTVGLNFRIIFELYIIMSFVFLFCKIWLRLGSRAKRKEVHMFNQMWLFFLILYCY